MSARPPDDGSERFLTVTELAALLNCCKETIYRELKRGSVPHLCIGNRYRFRKDETIEYFRRRSHKSE